jgi:DNA-binding NarL/FixJ family response regulator
MDDKAYHVLVLAADPDDLHHLIGLIDEAPACFNLETLHLNTRTFESGIPHTQQPDVILLVSDISLPSEMDTVTDVCHSAGETPVVLLTNDSDVWTRHRAIAAGTADSLLGWRFNAGILAMVLTNAVERQHQTMEFHADAVAM